LSVEVSQKAFLLVSQTKPLLKYNKILYSSSLLARLVIGKSIANYKNHQEKVKALTFSPHSSIAFL
jgi:hypothetical protein